MRASDQVVNESGRRSCSMRPVAKDMKESPRDTHKEISIGLTAGSFGSRELSNKRADLGFGRVKW